MPPIKRHIALQPLSRDHHHGLLLCFKIREGLKQDVSPRRIRAYCRYFFVQYLEDHFREEETHLFPLLPGDHPMVVKAIEQHEHLTYLFLHEVDDAIAVKEIEHHLQQHIRFEERQLFNEIEKNTPEEKLRSLQDVLDRDHHDTDREWEDQFWLKPGKGKTHEK